MNKKIFHIVYGCVVILMGTVFTGCTQEENLEVPSGLRVSLKEFQQEVHTRTVPANLEKPLVERFTLEVRESNSSHLAHSGKVTNELIPLSPGTYIVTASYGNKEVIGIDTPAYEGNTSVTLKTKEEKTVNLTCGVANALLSVKLTNPTLFNDLFSDYKVGVRVNDSSVKIGDFTKSIYFPAETAFSIFFEGRQKNDGSLITADLKHASIPATCKPGNHIILTMSVANVLPNISKVEVRREEISETIPVEWLPKPRIQSEAGFVDNSISFVETETTAAKLKFITASALQDVKLKFNFADETLAAYNHTEYLLSNPEHKSQLETLGIVLPSIGATTSSVNFQGLTSKIQTNAGVSTTNTVEVDVKANNRWSSENKELDRTYTFHCNKPEFNISVSDSSIWTKQFRFDPFGPHNVTAGSPDKLQEKMVFQVKEQGQSVWRTVDSKDLVCDGLTHNTTYQARSLYRGAIASNEITVTTYPETVLPNGDMEQWHITETKEQLKKVYRYYPYNQDDNNAWWTTNMERAVIWSVSPIELTTSPNVSYVNEGRNGSRAAEIRTSGHGGGYATTGVITYDEAAFAGRLFIGTYKWEKKSEVQTFGHSFGSRPSALSFWYKYTPYKTDAFKVYIQLKNAAGETLAEGSYIPTPYSDADNEYKQCIIQLTYNAVADTRPSSIYVDFASTKETTFHKNQNFGKTTYTYVNGDTRNCYMGSQLKIDDISLVYGK